MGCNDIWKISDFGISKIKTVPHGQSDLASKHLLVKFFKPKNIMDPSSGVENARFGGIHAAPEARELFDKVTRGSDVWSLDCVLALVLISWRASHVAFINSRKPVRKKECMTGSSTLKHSELDRAMERYYVLLYRISSIS